VADRRSETTRGQEANEGERSEQEASGNRVNVDAPVMAGEVIPSLDSQEFDVNVEGTSDARRTSGYVAERQQEISMRCRQASLVDDRVGLMGRIPVFAVVECPDAYGEGCDKEEQRQERRCVKQVAEQSCHRCILPRGLRLGLLL
jgi:hypothetical protein